MFENYAMNWHHYVVFHALEEVARGNIKKLMIFVPPRSGKSEAVSKLFPAWLLGINPKAEIILASYSASLANGFNKAVQNYIEKPEYGEIFPDTKIAGSHLGFQTKEVRTQSFFQTVNHLGSVRSTGVSGSLTGFGAGDGGHVPKPDDEFIGCGALIIDDPVKDASQAYSNRIRDNVFDWYGTTALTRVEKNTPIIICQTRWHQDDLSGRLLEKEGDDWVVVSLPAILDKKRPYDPREVGECLWPEWYPMDKVLATKKTIGNRDFAALYQQNPIPAEGNIIAEKDIQLYSTLPVPADQFPHGSYVMSCDLQFKETGSSFTVLGVMAKYESNWYLLDIVRKKMGFVETRKEIVAMTKRWPRCFRILVEDKANGSAIIDSIKSEVSGVIPVNPTASKDERLHAVSPLFEAGNVWIPKHHKETHNIISELTSFPASPNDDIVDMISMALQQTKLKGLSSLMASARM